MTERLHIRQLRIRTVSASQLDARRLAEALAASLEEAARTLDAPRRSGAVRIRIAHPDAGGSATEQLGAAIARAIVGSLR